MPYTYALYVCLIRMPYTCALYVHLRMPYMYVLDVCLTRMPYAYALYVCMYVYIYVCIYTSPFKGKSPKSPGPSAALNHALTRCVCVFVCVLMPSPGV